MCQTSIQTDANGLNASPFFIKKNVLKGCYKLWRYFILTNIIKYHFTHINQICLFPCNPFKHSSPGIIMRILWKIWQTSDLWYMHVIIVFSTSKIRKWKDYMCSPKREKTYLYNKFRDPLCMLLCPILVFKTVDEACII